MYVAAAVDGATRFIPNLVAMTNKVPLTLYQSFFAPIAQTFGFPDQLITDKGLEWSVCAFTCYLLARRAGRWPGCRSPHKYTLSIRNVRPHTPNPPTADSTTTNTHTTTNVSSQVVVERFNYEVRYR